MELIFTIIWSTSSLPYPTKPNLWLNLYRRTPSNSKKAVILTVITFFWIIQLVSISLKMLIRREFLIMRQLFLRRFRERRSLVNKTHPLISTNTNPIPQLIRLRVGQSLENRNNSINNWVVNLIHRSHWKATRKLLTSERTGLLTSRTSQKHKATKKISINLDHKLKNLHLQTTWNRKSSSSELINYSSS